MTNDTQEPTPRNQTLGNQARHDRDFARGPDPAARGDRGPHDRLRRRDRRVGRGRAMTAAELAEAGIDVVMLEEGGHHHRIVRRRHGTSAADAVPGRRPGTRPRDAAGAVLRRPRGRSTVINGGMSWRNPARVLKRWAEDDGIAAIGEQDMEPYFAEVESRISVRTEDPEMIGKDMRLLKAGAHAQGWKRSSRICAISCTARAATTAPTAARPARSARCRSPTSPGRFDRGARLYADCRVERITKSGRAVTGVQARFVRPRTPWPAPDRPVQGRRGRRRRRADTGSAGQVRAAVALRELGRNLSLHRTRR